MKRGCCVFALIFLACLGCASDGDKGQWDEFWKDLRGDNMQMRSDGSAIGGWGNSNRQLKSAD
jgi:hypothetical protein